MTYITATEYITEKKSKGEVLLFRRNASTETVPRNKTDEEATPTDFQPNGNQVTSSFKIENQTAIFHWEDVCYDIKIKKEERRILDNVDGWVRPGTLTALMVGIRF